MYRMTFREIIKNVQTKRAARKIILNFREILKSKENKSLLSARDIDMMLK